MLNSNALRVIEGSVAELPLSDDAWKTCKGRIYYIGCTETFRLKIGFTKGSTHARLRALQTGSPTRLVMLGCIPGTHWSEQRMHERFAAERAHGEWFKVSGRLYEHLIFVAYLALGEAAENHPILQFGRRALAVEAAKQSTETNDGKVS